MARRPVQLAFGQPYLAPGGDVQMMRRTPYSSITAGGVTRTTPAGTAVESVGATPTFSQMQAMRAARQPMLPPAPAGGPQLPPPPPSRRGLSFTPQSRGMLAGALAGLQYAGPQAQPTSFAQGLGIMGQAALEAFTKAEEREEEKAAAERAEKREIAKLTKPKFQVAGDRLFKIMPDGSYSEINGAAGPKPPKIKSEGERYFYDDRVIKTLIADDGSVYEAGNIAAGPIDMSKAQLMDPFTTMDMKALQKYREDNIRAPQKTLQIIDRLAGQIEKGPSGFVARQKAKISSSIKRLAGENPDYTEEELNLALQQGTLTQLVGAARLELFGPGVMTEFEQAMAREILAGNFDQLTTEEAINRLYQFRESFLPNYLESIEFYNNQPIVKSAKMGIKSTASAFNWGNYIMQEGAGSSASGANTTTGGSSWARVN